MHFVGLFLSSLFMSGLHVLYFAAIQHSITCVTKIDLLINRLLMTANVCSIAEHALDNINLSPHSKF